MQKVFKILILSVVIGFVSCSKEDVNVIEPTTNDDINYFIWRGLGTFYLWQKEVPDLADNRFASFDDLYTYFRGFSSPESIFNSLLYKKDEVDRFSWIVKDYVALENSFLGINVSNGMEFGLVRHKDDRNIVFGYVRYVVPNSDAASKGVKRGMLFNKVDGTQLTVNNFSSLLFSANLNYSIELADYNNGNPVSNGTMINLSKFEIEENPVKITKVFEENNTKIGYLMYNQFARNYDGQLNAAFSNLKSQNIDELIIDLRYNPGGSTRSATYLGSMITGQFNGQLYSKERWNEKVMNALSADRFENNFTNEILNKDSNGNVVLQESINSLNLSKVYFIISGSTASASELLINSLSTYIDVRVVGVKTTGKVVGSITLYDSDNLQKTGANLNPNHKYAMQPIVLEIVNSQGKNSPNGIIPAISLQGIQVSENFGNLGVLGNRDEPLLDRTIFYILTGQKSSKKKELFTEQEEIYNSKLATPTKDNMFVNVNRRTIKIN